MSAAVATAAAAFPRIERARAWLETKSMTGELLIIGSSLAAANELARGVAKKKGAVFGWHRLR